MKTLRWIALIVVVAGLGAVAALRFVPAVQDGIISMMADANLAVDRAGLLNGDALRVAICGSGSPMPDPARAPACTLVFAGGEIFVVDAGAGSWGRAARWRLPTDAVTTVLFTHFHSDHIGDLGEVNLQSWVGGRIAPLAVYGGPGIDRVVAGFNEAYALDRGYRTAHHGADFLPPELGVMAAHTIAGVAPGAPVTVLERNGLKITAFTVDHNPVHPAFGYRFDYKGRSVVISGDTHLSGNLAVAAEGADLLIHEAMMKDAVRLMHDAALGRDNQRMAKIMADILDYHATPKEAADTAAKAGVPHLLLSHLIPPVPHWFSNIVFLRDVDAQGVETRLAYDGMLIELPEGSRDVSYSDLD